MKARGRTTRLPKTTPITDRSTPHHLPLIPNTPRDSDASFYSNFSNASSHNPSHRPNPSSTVPLNDKSYQAHALRTVNNYLASHSAPFTLRGQLPSARDITSALSFLLKNLDYPVDGTSKLDDELKVFLELMGCPIKLSKSVFKSMGTPHVWPSLLGVMHWLVQIAGYNEGLSSGTKTTGVVGMLNEDKFMAYTVDGYVNFMNGEEEYANALDEEFVGKIEQESALLEEGNVVLEKEIEELAKEVERMRSAPSKSVVLEKEKGVLEDDVRKFHTIIDGVKGALASLEKGLEDKERELEKINSDYTKFREEKVELLEVVKGQKFNSRDAEMMKKKLQGVVRDIEEVEAERSAWEEKGLEVDSQIGRKLKELESISVECNQAIRRLKLGNDLQYALNPKGSTPADVLGIDYKLKLKPTFSTFVEELKKTSVTKYEEFISLQHQSRDDATKLDLKRNRLSELQSHIDAVESRLSLLRRETENFLSKCAAEAKTMMEQTEQEKYNVDSLEKEAEEMLKVCNERLEEAKRQADEEVQFCARELLMLADSVTKFKENMESTVSEMKREISETAQVISNVHKRAKPTPFGTASDDISQ